MPAWATVAITLGASGIAVVGTLLGGWLQDRRAISRATTEAFERRVAAGADVLARIEILLSDADPDRLGINVRREAPFEAFSPLQEAWLKNLRPALATFTLADHSAVIRDLGRQLEVAMSNSLTATGWWLRDLTTPAASLESRTRATEHHGEARQLAQRLMSAIRDGADS